MDDWYAKLKANPVFFVAVIVSVIGVILAVYGKMKNKNKFLYGGTALAVGALAVAVGSWYYTTYYVTPPDNGGGNGGTTGARMSYGTSMATAPL